MHKYTFILKIFCIFAPEINNHINIFFNMKTNLLKIVGLAIIAIAYSSCSKTDFIDEQNEAIASQQRDDYVANFIKKYGPVDPNKSWDMASMQPMFSLSPEEETVTATTRGTRTAYSQTTVTGFKVDKNVLQWCFTNIPAGKNNTSKGKAFYMNVPTNSFTIVPIFQGTATYYWELWMHVDGVGEIQIWKKGDNLGYRTAAGGDLSSPGTSSDGISKNAYEVEAPAITFSGLPTDNNMYFYLRSWNTVNDFNADTDKSHFTSLTSLNEMMLALNASENGCPRPAGVPADNIVNIIGCEDNGKGNSDRDFEDLVFMVYGLPPVLEPEVVYSTVTKRYMLEDLGATDDFDFNDIVVDVSEESVTTYTYKFEGNGNKVLDKKEGPIVNRQWAVVRAAGGTLDFTINIGSTSWRKGARLAPVETMRNTGWGGSTINYNAELDQFEISNKDWVPSANNITVTVDGRGRNLGVQEIKFPKKGEIPLIIAVDKTEKWMVERESVPDSWIQN